MIAEKTRTYELKEEGTLQEAIERARESASLQAASRQSMPVGILEIDERELMQSQEGAYEVGFKPRTLCDAITRAPVNMRYNWSTGLMEDLA